MAKKIACDEAIFAPQLALTYLASSAFIQEPGDWEGVRANVNDKVATTVVVFVFIPSQPLSLRSFDSFAQLTYARRPWAHTNYLDLCCHGVTVVVTVTVVIGSNGAVAV